MLTLLELNKAVNDTIKTALKGTQFMAVPLLAEDISEPIVRPSVKVAVERSVNGKLNSSCREKTLTIRVYFFASDMRKYKIENIKMQDVLETAFLDGIYVNGAYIPIENVESDVTDTVLICSFKMYIVELIETPEGELMEKLEIKGDI